MDINQLYREVSSYVEEINVWEDGDRIYSNYQKVVGYALRLTEMHNEIAMMEIEGIVTPEIKKFRTMILDPTIERFEKIAQYESRKITAMQVELNIEGNKHQ